MLWYAVHEQRNPGILLLYTHTPSHMHTLSQASELAVEKELKSLTNAAAMASEEAERSLGLAKKEVAKLTLENTQIEQKLIAAIEKLNTFHYL